MTALLSLLTVLTVSVIVTRVATVALTHTGLSRELARFQARSAFTGVGFTTREAEQVVGHPVRRRIVMALMLLGNAGLVSAVSTLVLTFADSADGVSRPVRLVLAAAGIAALWKVATSAAVDRWLSRLIGWALDRWTRLEVRDYASLLHLAEDHQVQELQVQEQDWLAGRTLQDLALNREGVVVLGIHREDGRWIGAPHGETEVTAGDVLTLYGKREALRRLDQRQAGRSGNLEHDAAVRQQDERVTEQERGERAAQRRRSDAGGDDSAHGTAPGGSGTPGEAG